MKKFLNKEHSTSNFTLGMLVVIGFMVGVFLERNKVFTSWKDKTE